MNRKVLAVVLGMVGLALSVPLPESSVKPQPQVYNPPVGRSTGYASDTSDEQNTSVVPAIAKAIAKTLPVIGKALANTEGTAVDKMNAITLSFLPMTREIIISRGKARKGYDTEYYLQQQEAAEVFVPSLLEFIKDSIAAADVPAAATIPPFQIPTFRNPAEDSYHSQEVLIPKINIPGNRFVPDILIPEVKV
ncbi:uncharacterized protein [Panulirus ornatus]|uniref:uncharacterized protein n=1 Tax=Panulirus ornatus TaxID=150431 RepID=UPI003A8662C6